MFPHFRSLPVFLFSIHRLGFGIQISSKVDSLSKPFSVRQALTFSDNQVSTGTICALRSLLFPSETLIKYTS